MSGYCKVITLNDEVKKAVACHITEERKKDRKKGKVEVLALIARNVYSFAHCRELDEAWVEIQEIQKSRFPGTELIGAIRSWDAYPETRTFERGVFTDPKFIGRFDALVYRVR